MLSFWRIRFAPRRPRFSPASFPALAQDLAPLLCRWRPRISSPTTSACSPSPASRCSTRIRRPPPFGSPMRTTSSPATSPRARRITASGLTSLRGHEARRPTVLWAIPSAPPPRPCVRREPPSSSSKTTSRTPTTSTACASTTSLAASGRDETRAPLPARIIAGSRQRWSASSAGGTASTARPSDASPRSLSSTRSLWYLLVASTIPHQQQRIRQQSCSSLSPLIHFL